jgi:hypothetical protein
LAILHDHGGQGGESKTKTQLMIGLLHLRSHDNATFVSIDDVISQSVNSGSRTHRSYRVNALISIPDITVKLLIVLANQDAVNQLNCI